MLKVLFGVLFSLWTSLACAGVSCTVPFTFVNGTTADANQVNADYAALVACLLNAAAAGNNNDITALLALTTPIAPSAGGTRIYVAGISTGAANAQVIASPSPTGFALTPGLSILFFSGFTNTGAVTLNVAGTGAQPLTRQTPVGTAALTGGEISAFDWVWAIWDGTEYQLINSSAQYGGFGPLTSLSSAAPDLGTIPSHNVTFTGNTTITAFGSSASTTYPIYNLNFSTVLVLTHNATSLILPSGTNITTASGDNAVALYLGSGNWQVISYQKANGTSVVSPTPLCGFSGLNVTNTTDSNINWSYTSSVLINPTGNVPQFSTSKSGSINITTGTGGTSTAGGMDGTGPGNNTFTYIYAIYNGTTWSAVGSITTPSTGPVMPAGYTHVCYMGAIKTNGSAHLYGTQILGNEARYLSGTANLTTLPAISSGTDGSAACATATPTFTAKTVRGSSGAGIWMPANAVAGDFVVTDDGGSAVVHMAPNTSYAGAGATNLSPIHVSASVAIGSASGRLLFEANTVQYCSATALGTAFAYGWKDAVNAN